MKFCDDENLNNEAFKLIDLILKQENALEFLKNKNLMLFSVVILVMASKVNKITFKIPE